MAESMSEYDLGQYDLVWISMNEFEKTDLTFHATSKNRVMCKRNPGQRVFISQLGHNRRQKRRLHSRLD